MQPFAGIKVVDFTHVLAGPFCTYQLAVLGADVIKIEPPDDPDMMRPEGHSAAMGAQGRGTQFICQNGNKRSLALDLRSEGGREVARRLVAKADVLVENYRKGVLDGFGLGYAQAAKLKPDLVYCSMTGFGHTGPKAGHVAYDNVIQAYSGLMAATGSREVSPLRVGPPVLDYGTGSQAAFAIAAALFQRSRTGEGQKIDVAMADAALMLMTTTVMDSQMLGETPLPAGNFNPDRPHYSCYPTADGQLVLGAFTVRQIRKLWTALGRPELDREIEGLSLHQALQRFAARDGELLARIFATKPADYWEVLLNQAGVPAARVRRMHETLAHPQVASRSVLQAAEKVPETGMMLKSPVAAFGYLKDGPSLSRPAPALGEHTAEVMAELGFSGAEIERLEQAGAVRGRAPS